MSDIKKDTTPGLSKTTTLDQVFNKKLMYKGALWLSLITVAAVAVIFFYHHTGDTFIALSRIKPLFILLCFFMVFIDLMLGSWRNHIFIRKLKPGLSHWVSFKANTANMFMGAVTPFHSGAGPAQLYVYHRHGLAILDGFMVSLINMGATLIFMPLAGIFAILFMDNQLESGMVPVLLRYGFSVFFIFLLAFLMAFWKPTLVGSVIRKVAGVYGRVFPSRKSGASNWADHADVNINRYQQVCGRLMSAHPMLFPVSLLLTTLLYLNKYGMQYVILLGLGVETSLVQVISMQVLIQFMIYFAPSPGGSGFAEAGIAVLFERIVPASVLSIFTLLQRSFLLFFPAMIGAYVIISLLKKHTSQP